MKPLVREMATCFASVSEDRAQLSYYQKCIYNKTGIEVHIFT